MNSFYNHRTEGAPLFALPSPKDKKEGLRNSVSLGIPCKLKGIYGGSAAAFHFITCSNDLFFNRF